MNVIDSNQNGMIDYTEFIAATLAVDEELNDEQLWSLFKKFDVDVYVYDIMS